MSRSELILVLLLLARIVNARIGYEADLYAIYFYANNLFDEEYITGAFVSGTTGSTLASYGDRRTFGIQVKSQL